MLGAESVNRRIELVGGDIIIVAALPFSVIESLASHDVYETLGIDDPDLIAQNINAPEHEI